jgi:SAM-dependent methyltransferase
MPTISGIKHQRILKTPKEKRSQDRIRYHYEIEKILADRLKSASREMRIGLYTECYEELFRAVGDHPQLARKFDNEARRIRWRLRLLLPLLDDGATLLEIGAGDCRLSIAAAAHVRRVIAIDVAPAIMARDDLPANVVPCLSDGTSIPVPAGSVDVAYSDQLMEHLHPDDAIDQLHNIFAALKPDGRYLCITPNRLLGPHDVSRYFDNVATGLHLREYTTGDLRELMLQVGFRDVRALIAARGRRLAQVPAGVVAAVERTLPRRLWPLLPGRIANALFGTCVVARK